MNDQSEKNLASCYDLLNDLCRRNAAVELSIVEMVEGREVASPNLRVRILQASNRQVIVEAPSATAYTKPIRPGSLVTVRAVDETRRWSFQTHVLQRAKVRLNENLVLVGLCLEPPFEVYSGQRRSFFRLNLVAADVPPVQIWQILDLDTCVEPENFNRLLHRVGLEEAQEHRPESIMPHIGRQFEGRLINISGGGIAVRAARGVEQMLTPRHDRFFWLVLRLPDVSYPIVVTARPVHHHEAEGGFIDLGLKFTFEHNPAHEAFVTESICRFAAERQRMYLQRNVAPE